MVNNLAVVFLCGLVLNWCFEKLRLPGLLGVLLGRGLLIRLAAPKLLMKS